jgi:tetratricopeptide (TPR) repeat protein
MPPSAPRRATLAALAACASACAAPRQPWRETRPAEVMIEVLPRDADVAVDAGPARRGARTVPVPDPAHRYLFRGSAPGFAPAEVARPGAELAGARIGLVLRPDGFGSARRLDLDEPEGLAAAGAALLRAGRPAQAIEYAGRAAELAPEEPLPRRVLGEAYRLTGARARAAQELSAYLRAAPDAPDREEVERAVEALRGDVVVPEPRR